MNANESLPGPEPANTYHRILVIDDDYDLRQLSFDVLTAAGYYVESVADGVAGWRVLQAARYDLIVTDHKLVRMTGLEMVEKMRAAAMNIPVIIAAKYLPMSEFARKAWLKPIVMLQRPFSNDVLLGVVNKVLRPAAHNVAATSPNLVKPEPAFALALVEG